MMICEYHDSCPINCARKDPTDNPDPFHCSLGGVDVRFVPVVPEVAEPEMMRCPGADGCGRCNATHCQDHERNAGCRGHMCGDHKPGPCVPVAAKPDPRQAMDDAWEKVLEARVSMGVLVEDWQIAADAWLEAGAPK